MEEDIVAVRLGTVPRRDAKVAIRRRDWTGWTEDGSGRETGDREVEGKRAEDGVVPWSDVPVRKPDV